jgi:hypothetical protein
MVKSRPNTALNTEIQNILTSPTAEQKMITTGFKPGILVLVVSSSLGSGVYSTNCVSTASFEPACECF